MRKTPLFLLLVLVFSPILLHADETIEVHELRATYQDRVYLTVQGAPFQAAFASSAGGTNNFKIYDQTLLDAKVEKVNFDGIPGKAPRASRHANVQNAFRDNVTILLDNTAVSTINGKRCIPVYQSTSGHRLYYVADSLAASGGGAQKQSYQLLVMPPMKTE